MDLKLTTGCALDEVELGELEVLERSRVLTREHLSRGHVIETREILLLLN